MYENTVELSSQFFPYRLPVYDPILSHYSKWYAMNTTTQYYLLFITQLTYFLSFVPLSKYFIFFLLSVTWFALYMLSHFKKRFKTFKTIFSFHVWHMAGVYFIRENSPENPMFCRKKNRTANHCWKGNIACEARKKPLKEEEHREWNKDSEKSTTQLKNNYKECLSFSLIKHEIVVNQKCEWCTYCGIHSFCVHIPTLMSRFT